MYTMRTTREIPKENHGKLVYSILEWTLSSQPVLFVQRYLRYGCYDWHRMLKTEYGKFLMVMYYSATPIKDIGTYRGVRVTYKTGSGLDDWIYWSLIHTTRDYRQYSAIADLHTLQFTVTHALGFLVFSSRILATDFISPTVTSNHTWSLLLTA
jgi:hypothetical protein